jgi:hypothetical protein
VAGKPSSGGTNTSGANPQVLYMRIYKVRDNDGNIIPNEYLGIQDFSGGGGCTPCDWNDNIIYLTNIRPENQPSAPSSTAINVIAETSFNIPSNSYLDNGYPGNELTYTALLNGVNPLPSWMFFDTSSGAISGVAPISSIGVDYTIEVTATDLHNAVVSTDVVAMVVEDELPWLETFDGQTDGSVSDTGDTAWSSSRDTGAFSVVNDRFEVNGLGGIGSWTSEEILIDGTVSISIDIDDDDNEEKETTDFIRAFYVLDGGTPVQFGTASDDISPQTFSVSGIVGSTLQIIVEATVSFTNEFYYFDNISVIGSSSLTASLDDFIMEDIEISNMKLHPNPTSGKVWVELNNSTTISKIEVFDIQGRLAMMVDGNEVKNRRSYLLDVISLNSGMYFVKVTNEDGNVTTMKLLVNK